MKTDKKERRKHPVVHKDYNYGGSHDNYHNSVVYQFKTDNEMFSDPNVLLKFCEGMMEAYQKTKEHQEPKEKEEEEVRKQTDVPAVIPSLVKESISPEEQLFRYICQLQKNVTPSFSSHFLDVIMMLLKDEAVSNWLFDTRHCHHFKMFNKGNVFKLGRVFSQVKLIEYETDSDLNILLEQSRVDTTYRKSMSYQKKQDSAILERIRTLILQNNHFMIHK